MHIINSKNKLSPSAFIPFCSFGENMEIVGTRIEGFNDPVCNSFLPTLHDNQLCYKIDLEKHRNNKDLKNQLNDGFAMILDYNENRQFVREENKESNDMTKRRSIFLSEKEESVSIHFDTISIVLFLFLTPTGVLEVTLSVRRSPPSHM